jgi:hypothetical protein
MEIAPADARLAAQSAIAFVDEVRLPRGFDPDLTAKAGKLQHSFLTLPWQVS